LVYTPKCLILLRIFGEQTEDRQKNERSDEQREQKEYR